MRVVPGDPLASIGGEGGAGAQRLTEEQLQAARESLGLNRPYYVQYLAWMSDVLRGNMGTSFWRGDPIIDTILRRGPITAQIAIMAIMVSWLLGIPIGLLSAIKRNTYGDYAIRTIVTVFMAIPSFWIGLVV